MRTFSAAVCLALIAVAASETAWAAPIPTGPDAVTQADADRQMMPYRLAQIEAYRAAGHDPATLHDRAAKFIEEVQRKRHSDTPSRAWPAIAQDGVALIAAGSVDPIVRANVAMACDSGERYDDARRCFREANEAFPKLGYAARWRFESMIEHAWFLYRGGWHAIAREHLERAIDLYGQMIGDESLDAGGSPYAYAMLRRIVEFKPYRERSKFTDHLLKVCEQAEGADPWLAHMSLASCHVSLGWYYRGTGWAHEVKKEDWPKFRTEMDKARTHLLEAHKLAPDRPHAAAEMVQVAKVYGSDLTPREWFDRAVKAQMDYYWAYRAMESNLMPRWGGSLDDLYKFGLECAATKRYDTDVPLHLIISLQHISLERGGSDDRLWKEAKYLDPTVEMLSAMMFEPSRADDRRREFNRTQVASKYLWVLMCAERYAEAIPVLEAIDHKPDLSQFTYGWRGPYTISGVYAGKQRAGDTNSTLNAGIAADATPAQTERALAIAETRLRESRGTRAELFWQTWTTQLNQRRAWQRGEWVDLTFDPTMSTWRDIYPGPIYNVIDEHTLEVETGSRPLSVLLKSSLAFPGPVQIQVDIEVLRQSGAGLLPGVGLGDSDRLRMTGDGGRFFWFNPDPNRQNVGAANHRQNRILGWPVQDVKSRAKLHVVSWEKGAWMFVDGFPRHDMTTPPVAHDGRVWLGTYQWMDTSDGRVRFRNLRIRRMDVPAPTNAQDPPTLIDYFTKMIDRDVTYPWCYFVRGVSYHHTGRYAEAIEDLKRVPGGREDAPLAARYYALALMKARRDVDAVAAFREAVRLHPDDEYSRQNLAWILSTSPVDAARNGKEAIEVLAKSKPIEQDPSFLVLAWAAAYAETGRFDEAERVLDEGIKRMKNPAIRGKLEQALGTIRAGKPMRMGPVDR